MIGRASERRQSSDRRQGAAKFRIPERRTGFDRRLAYPVLGVLRDNSWQLAVLLIAINILSLADWWFTMRALELGASEGNPVLSAMLESNPAMAAGFKLSITIAVTLGIWAWRRYRLVLATSVFGVTAYALVIVYHIGGLSAFGVL
ncbi:MAG: hypothetical protein HY876_00225 [Coriobacteriales bacterium]|nr:hypothetical protein [Coriobacteriales bacterium]